jgi:hypothetical protein
MARSLASVFVDDATTAARAAEVPSATFNSGGFGGGGAGPGIGISTQNPGLEQSLPNWTLQDQHGNDRINQIGQNIGGSGYSDAGTSSGQEGTLPESTIRMQDVDTLDGTGALSLPAGGAALIDLADGWELGA